MKALNVLVVLLVSVFPRASSAEQGWTAQSPTYQAHLIELYTSQGCSSCPPADAWLLEMAEQDPHFRRVVPVAFHVSYWNSLGWLDAYAHPSFDLRQRELARRGLTGVYTPGMFLNGVEWRQWRRGSYLPRPAEVGQLSFAGQDKGVTTFRFDAHNAVGENVVLHTAFLTRHARTQVTRGENRGRELQEGHIVRAYRSFNMPCGDLCQVEAELEAPLDSNVLVAWLTDPKGEYLQATGTRF